MSFGEHLEELRMRIIRLLLGGLVGMIVCFIFEKHLMRAILWPVDLACAYHDVQREIIFIDPTEPFVVVMKVSIYCGLIFTAPWGLYQLWAFVAAGLYSHEQRFVRQFFPLSVILFAAGVTFCFTVVMPLVFTFLIGIRTWVPPPDAEPSWLIRQLLPKTVATQPATTRPTAPVQLPMFETDPCEPMPGQVWVNTRTNQLLICMPDGKIRVTGLSRYETESFMQPRLTLSYIVSFVTRLALGFGIGFQVPIVVVLLAMIGIFSVKTMGSVRRYVLLIMVAASAVVTPPDVTSQILLAVPMYLLYEGGLIAARIVVRRREQEKAEASGGG